MYNKKYKVQRAIVVAICVYIPKKRVAKKVNAVITFMLEPKSTSVNCGSCVVKTSFSLFSHSLRLRGWAK